jgi:hypothetical protein
MTPSTICRRVRRWVTSCPGGGGRAAEPRQGGQGAVSRTSSDRQYTPTVTREKKRLCVLVFCTPHLDLGRAV